MEDKFIRLYINTFFIAAFALLFFGLLSSCSSDDSSKDSHSLRAIVDEAEKQYHAGNYNETLELLQGVVMGLKKNPKGLDDENFIKAYFFLGNVYFAFTDYEQAGDAYMTAFQRAEKSGTSRSQLRLLANLSYVAYYQDDRESAERYAGMVDSLELEDKNVHDYYKKILKAYYQIYFGDIGSGVDQMKLLTDYVDQAGLPERFKLSPISAVYEGYEKQGRLDSALVYLERYSQMADAFHLSNLMTDSRKGFMRVYTKLGDRENALKYQEEYFALSDSLMNSNRYLKLNSDFNEAIQKDSQKKIETLELRVSMTIAVIVVILVTAMFIGLWIIYRTREQKTRIQLFKRNREIARLEENIYQQTEHDASPGIDSSPNDEDDGCNPDDNICEDADVEKTQAEMSELYGRILRYLNTTEDYCDHDFCLNILAKKLQSNTKYVSQAINDVGHKNFRSLINEYRISVARRRLLDKDNYGNVTIQYLATSVGFSSTSTFNSVFKKMTGLTPTMYEKLGKEKH